MSSGNSRNRDEHRACGTRNVIVISWPARIKDAGGIRTQWHHVVDITPTILAATKLPQPGIGDGINLAEKLPILHARSIR